VNINLEILSLRSGGLYLLCNFRSGGQAASLDDVVPVYIAVAVFATAEFVMSKLRINLLSTTRNVL
jgi:hypothetical protein